MIVYEAVELCRVKGRLKNDINENTFFHIQERFDKGEEMSKKKTMSLHQEKQSNTVKNILVRRVDLMRELHKGNV